MRTLEEDTLSSVFGSAQSLDHEPGAETIADSQPGTGTFTIYTTQPVPSRLAAFLAPTIIPCHRIWDAEGELVPAIVAYKSS